MTRPSHSRLTRTLHWLTLLLFLALLASGLSSEAASRAGQAVPDPLLPHMILGGALLVLLLWRIWRKASGAVPRADTRIADLGHWVLLIGMTAMAASGMATSLAAGLAPIALSGGPMPDLTQLPPRAAHGAIYLLLILLILGHAAMAVWHQWGKRDGTLSGMIRG